MDLFALVDRYTLYNVLAPESVKSYRTAAKALSTRLPPQAQDDIGLIDEEMLLRFRMLLLRSHAPVTYNCYRRQLKALFRFALENQLLTRNPWQKVGAAPDKIAPAKTLSDDSIHMITKHLKDKIDEEPFSKEAWFWLTVTQTLYYTGIRRRQAVALKWRDILFKEKLIVLRSEASKTRREWHIPIPVPLIEVLEHLRTEAETKVLEVENRLLDSADPVFDAPLFCSGYGPLSPASVTTYYWRLGRRLGIKISPHRFRHTLATRMANGQANIKVVQEFLGHSDVRTTCAYIRPSLPAMREAVAQIPEI